MKKINLLYRSILFSCTLLLAAGCSNTADQKKEPGSEKDSAVVKKPVVETKRAPVINIGDTVSVKRVVLTVKDSAATMERVTFKLGEIYGVKLAAVIQKNKLTITGPPMAWYKTQKAPYFFEAGLPVDKKPARPSKGVQIKETGTDSVVVAHFYGPYELLPQAYDVLKDLVKERKKSLKGIPYEIYVDDPVDNTGKLKDPYKVQTDVVFPLK